MKRALFPFLLLPMLAYGQAKSGDELLSSGLKKYSFERLKITYQLSGDAEGGIPRQGAARRSAAAGG